MIYLLLLKCGRRITAIAVNTGMSSKSFLDLANSILLKSTNVTRYSSNYQSRVETLSDHITEVSMMSYIISMELINLGDDVNVGEVLEYALAHDAEEIKTGDVVRSLKYYDTKVLNELKRVAEEVEHNYTSSMGYSRLHNAWINAKSGKSGLIIKIVDMLCVARKCITEIELLGNCGFLNVAHEAQLYIREVDQSIKSSEYYHQFTSKGQEYLSDLIDGAYNSLCDIVNHHSELLSLYHIDNTNISTSNN